MRDVISKRELSLKTLSKARLSKKEREKKVLFGLVEAYIKSPQPIGSKTLKEDAFQEISSATIRNYFSTLEEQGFLSQQHASGGRIPTEKAYKAYAQEFLRAGTLDEGTDKRLKALQGLFDKEIGAYLFRATELLSEISGYPVFLSTPRFDQDALLDIKLVGIDANRCLCVLVTELGLIHTETLYLQNKLHLHALMRIEEALLAKVKGKECQTKLDATEQKTLQSIYHEVMVRYIMGYSNFSTEDLHKTGLSRLLVYPEFNNAETFASSLSLFENDQHLRELIRKCAKDSSLKYFIGEDLLSYFPLAQSCTVLALPYTIHGKIVGVVGLLGPQRLAYRRLFGLLRAFSEYISQALSTTIIKHQLSYRMPKDGQLYLESKNSNPTHLIEDQRDEGDSL